MPDKGAGAHESGQPEGAVPVNPNQESALDAALAQTQDFWSGHPSQGVTLTDEDDAEGAAKKGASKEEDDLGEEEDLGEAQGKDTTEKPPKPPKPKGKTLEEEAGYRREAERWAGELNQENKDLKAQNTDLQKRLEALEKKVEGTGDEGGEKPSGKGKESGPGPMAGAKDRIRDLLVQIDELDEFDPDFYDKKADLMAQLYGGAKGAMPSEEELQRLVAKAVKEAKAAEETERTQEERAQKAAKKVVSMAKKLGLDMREGIGKDEEGKPLNSLDWDLFWDASVRAPKDTSLEEQVRWIVKEVKRMKGQIRSGLSRELEDAGAHHRDTAVLERHGPGRRMPGETTSAPPHNFTLQDALARAQRRV